MSDIKSQTLLYGDNLEILRESIDDKSVDLIYLDPPFNSDRSYNVLFKTKTDRESTTQIKAFDDTWTWGKASAMYYHQLLTMGARTSEVIKGLKEVVGANDLMAYLVMMAIRLVELHRVLKDTGSMYLHCDPTASHHLKVILDAVFGPKNFKAEIIWKRATSTQKGSQHAAKKPGRNHDVILMYVKNTRMAKFKSPKRSLTEDEADKKFNKKDPDGRRWMDDSTHIWRTPGMGNRPNLCYTWRGFKNRHPSGWRLSRKRQEEEYQKGNFEIKKSHDGKDKLIRKVYEENYQGANIGDLWDDIAPAQGNERLGYPTQKPLSLLERIINMSSEEGDMVLDPFCGCGTAVHAAQRLNRNWIGIDVTHLAIGLIEYRMNSSWKL